MNGYPAGIGEIFINRCASSGCHNTQSSVAAGRLNLETWENMFKGGRGNSVVIPYSPGESTVMLFSNTYTDLGVSVEPTMPYGQKPLSREEIILLQNWIAEGAKNNRGQIAFPESEVYNKTYVLNSSCDKITVIDNSTRLIMRYIDLGPYVLSASFAEMIKMDEGSRFGYVLFNNGLLVQFDADKDEVTNTMDLGQGIWRSMAIVSGGGKAVLADWSGNSGFSGGKFVLADLMSMNILATSENSMDSIYFPSNLTYNKYNSTFYASCNAGNFLYSFQLNGSAFGPISKIILDESGKIKFQDNNLRPSFIEFMNGGEDMAVICQSAGEMRILNGPSYNLKKIINLGKEPQEITIAERFSMMFISCMEDETSFENGKGSVFVISTSDYSIKKIIYSGYQPRSLVYDDLSGIVFVANRNADNTGGDQPHHYTGCEGKNGYLRYIDVQTLEVLNTIKTEVLVDPYSMAIKEGSN